MKKVFGLIPILSVAAVLFGCAGSTSNSANNSGTTTSTSSTSSSSSGSGGSTGTGTQSPTPPAPNQSNCGSMATGQLATLNGYRPFPTDSLWNTDISSASVDANSSAMISFIGPNIGMHADFGSGLYNGSNIGIPYMIVDGTQARASVNFTAYGSESDPGSVPVPITAPIEGDPNPGNGDRHVLVIDNQNCWLYELGSAYPNGSNWNANVTAIWDLLSNEQRPWTWTSVDAAGLPIFPGLVRYDEVAAGAINHAIRFTLQNSRAAMVPPASHWAANSSSSLAAPMGMKMRLKASFDVSGYSAANKVILNAMKKYGIIMADNGSSMYISGAPDSRWDNNDLHNLGNVKTSDFEVVQMSPVYTASTVPSGAAPTISTFTAGQAAITNGSSTTLSWTVANASYLIIAPVPGPVRGSSVSVSPTATTTYTLYATNQYGRTQKTVTVNVQ